MPIDLVLGLDISFAAERAGTTATAFVEQALRLVLALGAEETARLRASLMKSASAN